MRWSSRRRERGQGLTEFSLVAPIFFFVVFAALDGGLLLYSANTASHTAQRGVLFFSAAGDSTGNTSAGLGDADAQAVAAMQSQGLGTLGLARVTEYDLYKTDAAGNVRSDCQDPSGNGGRTCVESFDGSGNHLVSNWPPATRNVTNGNADFARLDVHYTYRFLLVGSTTLTLTESKIFRLEPQT